MLQQESHYYHGLFVFSSELGRIWTRVYNLLWCCPYQLPVRVRVLFFEKNCRKMREASVYSSSRDPRIGSSPTWLWQPNPLCCEHGSYMSYMLNICRVWNSNIVGKHPFAHFMYSPWGDGLRRSRYTSTVGLFDISEQTAVPKELRLFLNTYFTSQVNFLGVK
jgi:hypothetical protein